MKIEILKASSHVEMVDVEKISTRVGATLEKYGTIDKTLGKIEVQGWGFDCYENERVYIEIIFKMPDTMPSKDDLIEMLNAVIGSDNEYHNTTTFVAKFWDFRIDNMMEELFKDTLLPEITEEMIPSLKLQGLRVGWRKTISLGTYYSSYSFDPVKKHYPEELKYIKNMYLDIIKRKLFIEIDAKGFSSWVEANTDHEKVFAYYIKNENMVEALKQAIPTLEINDE